MSMLVCAMLFLGVTHCFQICVYNRKDTIMTIALQLRFLFSLQTSIELRPMYEWVRLTAREFNALLIQLQQIPAQKKLGTFWRTFWV